MLMCLLPHVAYHGYLGVFHMQQGYNTFRIYNQPIVTGMHMQVKGHTQNAKEYPQSSGGDIWVAP